MNTVILEKEIVFNVQQKLNALIPWIVQAGRLDIKESERIKNSIAAEIITTIAYLSRCTNPERIIVSHILTLIADTRTNGLFSHKYNESLADRLKPVNYYPDGDKAHIKAGMLLLELLSLNDHREDIINDMRDGNDNPLIINLSYDKEYNRILNEYNKLPEQVKKQYENLFRKVIKAAFWF